MYKVLIADDESIIQRGITRLINWDELNLSIAGYAANGEEALRKIAELRPDILLCDIKMPVKTGLEVIRALADMRARLHIVVISGYDDFEYVREAMLNRVDNYLLKPVDQSELKQTLSGIVEQLDREKADAAEDRNQLRDHVLWRLLRRQIDEEELRDRLDFLGMSDQMENRYRVARVFGGDTALFTDPAEEKLPVLWRLPDSERSAEILILSGADAEIADALNMRLNQSPSLLLIAVGRPVKSLMDIAASYDDAKWISDYRLLGVQGRILWKEDMPDDISGRGLDAAQIDALKFALERGDRESAYAAIDQYAASLSGSGVRALANAFIPITAACVMYARQMRLPIERVLAELPSFDQIAAGEGRWSYPAWLKALSGQIIDRSLAARNSSRIDQILGFIERHYQNDLSLKQIAERFSLSPAYLGTIIKNATGELFSVYLNRYRIDRAKERLEVTEESASAIGKAIGFQDVNYFYKVFRKYTGEYPTDYRRRTRGEGDV